MRFSLTRSSVWIAAAALSLPLAADDEVKNLPDVPGREAVARVCLDCHGTGNFRKARLSKEEWADQVAEMVDRGAKGSKADLDQVIEYLTQNFGPDSKINVNTAPLIELKSVLGITAPEAKAMLDYRDANGKFKDWGDLQKITGLDAKKIEGKKDLIVF